MYLKNSHRKMPTDTTPCYLLSTQRKCQEATIVPIVEPEVLMEGSHTMEKA